MDTFRFQKRLFNYAGRIIFPAIVILAIALPALPEVGFAQTEPFKSPTEERYFDEEYYIDIIAFSFPREWDELWADSGRGYRITAASLDKDNLFIEQEFKFEYEITPRFMFNYNFTESGNLDEDSQLHNLKLRYNFGGPFWVGIHGWPTFKKKYARMGVHLYWFESRRQFQEIYVTFVDFLYNQKNSLDDRYNVYPIKIGSRGEVTLWDRFMVRHDVHLFTQATHRYPDEDYNERFQSAKADLTLEYVGGERWVGGARGRLFWQEESIDSIAYDIYPYSFDSLYYIVQPYFQISAGELTFIPGGVYVHRSEDTDLPMENNSCRFTRDDYCLYFETDWKPWERVGLRGAWYSGYISEKRRCDYPGDRENSQYETVNKLVTMVEIHFRQTARMIFNSTFDPESPFSHFWDGGNVMFIATF